MEFVMLNMQTAMKSFDRLVSKKNYETLTRFIIFLETSQSICLAHYIHNTVYTDCLALINRTTSLPAVCTQVQQWSTIISELNLP